jgi:hypothetical protein
LAAMQGRGLKTRRKRCATEIEMMSEPRQEINFAVIQDYLLALRSQVSGIEECVRARHWAEAIDDCEGMLEIVTRLVGEFRKGV